MHIRTYEPHERPDILVLVEGTWYQGELRQWRWRDDVEPIGWWASVQWRRGPGEGTYLDQMPAERVREDIVDRSIDREPQV